MLTRDLSVSRCFYTYGHFSRDARRLVEEIGNLLLRAPHRVRQLFLASLEGYGGFDVFAKFAHNKISSKFHDKCQLAILSVPKLVRW